MRAVIQRVSEASVRVGEETVGAIGPGLLVLLGVGLEDGEIDAAYLVRKIVGLRIFRDAQGLMNLSAQDVGAELLVVSQFTLFGDCRRGRRPSFARAGEPGQAEQLYEHWVALARQTGLTVHTGRFGAMMDVALVNDGPVTLLLDSTRQF